MIAKPTSTSLLAPALAIAMLTAACWPDMDPGPPDCGEWPEDLSCETSPQLCSLPLERVHGEDAAARRLVIVAEGYTESELSYFRGDVEELVHALLNDERSIIGRSPELFRVDLLPAASVADGEGGSFGVTPMKGCLGLARTSGGRRFLTVPGPLVEVVREAHGLEPRDVVITLFNTKSGTANASRGGPGYLLSVAEVPGDVERWSTDAFVGASVNLAYTAPPGTLDHELAHALVGLGDEYGERDECFSPFMPFSSEPGGLTGIPNLSLDADGAKWAHVVAGAEEGGATVSRCVFHPPGPCRMKSSRAEEYCPVCEHAIAGYLEAIGDGNDGTPRCAIETDTAPDAVADDVFVTVAVADHDGPTTAVLFAGDEKVLVGTNSVSIDARFSWHVPRERIPDEGLTVSAFCADAEGRVDDSALTLTLAR